MDSCQSATMYWRTPDRIERKKERMDLDNPRMRKEEEEENK